MALCSKTKHFLFYAIVFAASIILPACEGLTAAPHEDFVGKRYYNVCLVLDGTDRLSGQNGVPCVVAEEMVDLARTLADNGMGSLYLCYVDNNSDNNRVAMFEWSEHAPKPVGDKPGYMKMADYDKQVAASQKAQDEYQKHLKKELQEFFKDCSGIVDLAYSDAVARQKKGSDVNGAINKAARLLKASSPVATHSYIILVSDGCDNVGKELSPLPRETELFLINSSVSKHQYGELVSREFVTLKQAAKHLFN